MLQQSTFANTEHHREPSPSHISIGERDKAASVAQGSAASDMLSNNNPLVVLNGMPIPVSSRNW